MRTVRLSLALLFVSLALPAVAQEEEFPGVEKLMSPKAFEEAGLNKLTPEERARLNEFIGHYVAGRNQEVAKTAVEKAVKENKVPSEPQVIESRIVGRFKGYAGDSRFALENGQVWAQAQRDARPYPPIESPPVIIVKQKWGWRMYVLGGGNVRVTRLK